MTDKTLTCKDCGAVFIFSESEQTSFLEKGYHNDPQRCQDCRAARKLAHGNDRGQNQNNNQRTEREMFPAVCASCGKSTTVPFLPGNDKPVYCRTCYQARRR